MSGRMSEYCGLANLTYKMNHQRNWGRFSNENRAIESGGEGKREREAGRDFIKLREERISRKIQAGCELQICYRGKQ